MDCGPWDSQLQPKQGSTPRPFTQKCMCIQGPHAWVLETTDSVTPRTLGCQHSQTQHGEAPGAQTLHPNPEDWNDSSCLFKLRKATLSLTNTPRPHCLWAPNRAPDPWYENITIVVQWKRIQLGNLRLWVRPLALLSGLRIWCLL